MTIAAHAKCGSSPKTNQLNSIPVPGDLGLRVLLPNSYDQLSVEAKALSSFRGRRSPFSISFDRLHPRGMASPQESLIAFQRYSSPLKLWKNASLFCPRPFLDGSLSEF